MIDSYLVNPVSAGEEVENEPIDISDDDEENDVEMNYFTDSQLALIQPTIFQPYGHPPHFTIPDDNLIKEFVIEQQFENKEEVLMAIKMYIIKRVVEYKILESDHLKYSVQSTQLGEVRRYNGPHSCLQTSTRQDHRRLKLKVIAQAIFTMVKADLTISIRILQRSVETYFGYKASYRKI
ncbi:hypothetical protein Ahy_A04g018832 [Arachis hypogaea]|uniref:Transposase MuDR plant domain-containing protein n=1 Tax=Arachis hypogaea TaxID=3818 RepID=A0A445DEQ1_ARAHY|nr:hypothetical protein Ahy_A04g018832 [Arachis hypogaea]